MFPLAAGSAGSAVNNMTQPSRIASLVAAKFHMWHKTGSPGRFVRYLKDELSGVDRTWLQKGSMRETFVEAGINPDVHVLSRLNRDDVKGHLRQIIVELAEIVGDEGLHDNAMNSPEVIPLPPYLRCPGTFPLSRKFREEAVISKQALQRKLVKAIGKAWAEILEQTGFSHCNRRISSRSFNQTVQLFVDLNRESESQWTKQTLREEHHVAFRAAWNLISRMNTAGVPVPLRRELRNDPIFTLWSVASAYIDDGNMDRAVTVFLRKKPLFAQRFAAPA